MAQNALGQLFRQQPWDFQTPNVGNFLAPILQGIEGGRRDQQQALENARAEEAQRLQRDQFGLQQGRFGMDQQRFTRDMALRDQTDPLTVQQARLGIDQTRAGIGQTQASTAATMSNQRRQEEQHRATMAQFAQMTPDQRRQVAPSIGITPGTPDHTEFIISGNFKPANANAAQSITWGRDAQGNPVPLQATRDGKLIASQMPAGVVALPPPEMAYARSLATEQGTAAGKAQVDLPSVETNTQSMLTAIDGVANNPYLDRMTGWSGNLPNMTPAARDAQAKIDQVQGKAFLQAFAGLRGGGAITEAEGAKATASLSRLQETRVGTPEYRQALADVRREVLALQELARRKAQGGNGYRSQAVIPPPGQPQTPLPRQSPAGDPLSQARDAIGRGADRAAVIERLRKNGIDPAGL